MAYCHKDLYPTYVCIYICIYIYIYIYVCVHIYNEYLKKSHRMELQYPVTITFWP